MGPVASHFILKKYWDMAIIISSYLSLDATRPVFGVSDKARLKPVSSATETS